jgi:hypothetical protein
VVPGRATQAIRHRLAPEHDVRSGERDIDGAEGRVVAAADDRVRRVEAPPARTPTASGSGRAAMNASLMPWNIARVA